MAASSSFSSSSSAHVKRFDVFPSFHGPDVRRGFLSHLNTLFASKGITMFKDHEIERGRAIESELVQAIRESRISIVLLSKNYASSSWCLDELVEILKCREDQEQIVMPIFYDVEPSHVRRQKGDFGIAFEKTCEGETEEKKRRWREALTCVATIAGEHSHNWTTAEEIKKFATDVTLSSEEAITMMQFFEFLDADQDGFITLKELQNWMKSYGGAYNMMRDADLDGDGQINFDEFVKFQMATTTGEEAETVDKLATYVCYKINKFAKWLSKNL